MSDSRIVKCAACKQLMIVPSFVTWDAICRSCTAKYVHDVYMTQDSDGVRTSVYE